MWSYIPALACPQRSRKVYRSHCRLRYLHTLCRFHRLHRVRCFYPHHCYRRFHHSCRRLPRCLRLHHYQHHGNSQELSRARGLARDRLEEKGGSAVLAFKSGRTKEDSEFRRPKYNRGCRRDPSFLSHIHSALFPRAAPFCTSASAMADVIQRLPLELLAEILGHVSVPDVLRFEQVEAITQMGTDKLKTDDMIDRSTATSAMPSSHLLYFNTR